MAKAALHHPRWFQLEGAECANEVTRIAEGLKQDATARVERYRFNVSLYEGRFIERLTPEAYGSYRPLAAEEPLTYNLHRSACDTVQAEIAGRQKPKPMFTTNGGDWKQRRRAKKLDKFVEAQLRQPQGPYANAWELMEDVWLDALIFGTGVAKVFSEPERVTIERSYPWEIFVDPTEAKTGQPRNIFHIYSMDLDIALREFCGDDDEGGEDNDESDVDDEDKKAAILSAPMADTPSPDMARVAHPIEVIEAWRLPLGPNKPGKHVFVINGCVVHEEEWESEEFPFVFVRWARQRFSFWGKSLIEEGEGVARETNVNAEKLQARFAICGSKRTYYHADALVDESQLEQNDHEVLIKVKPGAQFPREDVPHPIGPGEVEWLESNFRRYYELTGVSQMNATARKEPGITAGVAIRTMNDMQSARFSVKAKSYENAFPLLGRRIVACAREVAADNDYKLPWPGQAFHREISWKRDAELQEDMYSVQLSPASAMPNDPAGKLQTAQELFQAGVINPPAFKRLIDMPDLEDELKAESAERDYLEDLVDRYLDADKDDEDFEFEGPQGYILDKPGALALVAQHYFQSKRQRAPEFNQSLLRTYMKLLDKQISAATAPPQVMAGGLGPTPMTPAPGGPLPPAAAPPLPAAA